VFGAVRHSDAAALLLYAAVCCFAAVAVPEASGDAEHSAAAGGLAVRRHGRCVLGTLYILRRASACRAFDIPIGWDLIQTRRLVGELAWLRLQPRQAQELLVQGCLRDQ
jgi:hypothetical protein